MIEVCRRRGSRLAAEVDKGWIGDARAFKYIFIDCV